MTARELSERSIEVILANQAPSGAFVASPTFRQYRYSWLRDGSFIAYALLRWGRPEACRRFLEWAHRAIQRHAGKLDRIERKHAAGRSIDLHDLFPARFSLEGKECHDDWPNYQIDGYGSWLWCLAEYCRRDASALEVCAESIETVTRYLSLVWRIPNYDCWEENGDGVHPSTLACVSGGVRAINGYLKRTGLAEVADAVRDFVCAHLTPDGTFAKSIGSPKVDASLLWLTVPFGLVDPLDPRMRRTVRQIEEKLLDKGGVKRFEDDTYYGGGQWILLTAWLGWYYMRLGDGARARGCREWVIAQCDQEGDLPEQVLAVTNDPVFIEVWRARWGEVARPLLWSHAMYLVLQAELEGGHQWS